MRSLLKGCFRPGFDRVAAQALSAALKILLGEVPFPVDILGTGRIVIDYILDNRFSERDRLVAFPLLYRFLRADIES